MLPDAPYVWIRFGAEDGDGWLVYYANPFTQGHREQNQYQTFWGCVAVPVPVNVLSPDILCDDRR